MLKKHHRFFQSLQLGRDVLAVMLAAAIAYWLRFHVQWPTPHRGLPPTTEVYAVLITLALTWPVLAWRGGLYASRRSASLLSEVLLVARTTGLALVVVVAVTYFFRDHRFSRTALTLWAAGAVLLVSGARVLSRIWLRALRRRGWNLRHVIVVGDGALAMRVVRTMGEHAEMGLRVVGRVTLDAKATDCLGTIQDLREIVQRSHADQVILALPMNEGAALAPIMETLSKMTVDVRFVPDLLQYVTLCGGVEEFAGLPIMSLQSSPMLGWSSVVKRAFDIVVAATGLAVAAPVLALIALAVRLTSRGAIFYAQERVGMDGAPFRMLKFRSMQENAEEKGGARWAQVHDPRRTRLGVFLRRTSLDELPQLFNVLLGDMSLVGPRPERPCFIEEFKSSLPRYVLRQKIKAGMTGWAQVNGLRGNTSLSRRLELDLYYIEHWSLSLDIKILLRTVLGGFLSPNAY